MWHKTVINILTSGGWIVRQKLNLILIKMKRINLKAAIESFASQQAKIANAEAPYAESDPYANID